MAQPASDAMGIVEAVGSDAMALATSQCESEGDVFCYLSPLESQSSSSRLRRRFTRSLAVWFCSCALSHLFSNAVCAPSHWLGDRHGRGSTRASAFLFVPFLRVRDRGLHSACGRDGRELPRTTSGCGTTLLPSVLGHALAGARSAAASSAPRHQVALAHPAKGEAHHEPSSEPALRGRGR